MHKIIKISLYTILMFFVIVVVGRMLKSSDAEITTNKPLMSDMNINNVLESKIYKQFFYYNDYHQNSTENPNRRTINEYYSTRAFNGAPPYIKHDLDNNMTFGGKSCNQCHKKGGFVPKLNNFAPITPHPEFGSCTQCHVRKTTNSLFVSTKKNEFKKPKLNNQALIGTPKITPHQIQLRENCAACHSGPAAPEELRFDHPQRKNCLQCHPTNHNKPLNNIWVRKTK